MTNLFKFVSLRPPQLVNEEGTKQNFIRDKRVKKADGNRILLNVARQLISPAVALQRWREVDHAILSRFNNGYRKLIGEYEALTPDDDLPDGRSLLRDAELPVEFDRIRDEELDLVWNALYTAYYTGPGAGQLLEAPMAAVRVYHFAESLRRESTPDKKTAIALLGAKPIIPRIVDEFIVGNAPDRSKVEPETRQAQPNVERSKKLLQFAREIATTENLLSEIANAPSVSPQVSQEGNTRSGEGWFRSDYSIRTTPALGGILSGKVGQEQAGVLSKLKIAETAPVPVAAKVLQTHLNLLGNQTLAVADDPEFQSYLMDFRSFGNIVAEKVVDRDVIGTALFGEDPSSASDVDVHGKIVPLGIGDLKVVKHTLLAYVAGEVAHIENVLKGETKERKHRALDRTEITVFSSEEETRTNERDTQSTDRFELKKELEQTMKEDMSVKAGLTVTATLGPVITTATGDFAYSTSKTDSIKSSSNFAKELVDRSVSKIETKTKNERTTKTISEVEEINTHGLNNVDGPGHIIGIYRWVDKKYRAQIYNYGVRLLLEFIVPEPAAFYRASLLQKALVDLDAVPPADFVNMKGSPLTAKDITEGDYMKYASRYNAAGITPPPSLYTFIGTSLVKEGLEMGKTIGMAADKFVVPDGYTLNYYSATITVLWVNHVKFTLQIGRDQYPILNKDPGSAAIITNSIIGAPEAVDYFTGLVPVTVASYDVLSYAVNVLGLCLRTSEAFVKWQLQTFDKIYTAYQALKNAYDQKVSQAQVAAGIVITGNNPAQNRIIEKNELKKHCISLMTGEHFKNHRAMTDPMDKPKHYPEIEPLKSLEEGKIVQFFEQAFEWEQISYLYYPYFWGRKKNWIEVIKQKDNDPLFMQFLSAGSARVVVPVPIAYSDAVQYLLQSGLKNLRDKVWLGGERPTIEDDLYISITDELRDQTDDLNGAVAEGLPWEYTLPTTLVWLQPDSTLPVFT